MNGHQHRLYNRTRIPVAIWVLGLVGMLMDSSSELVHSLLPVFLVSVMGVSALTVGLIEGTAEAAARTNGVRRH